MIYFIFLIRGTNGLKIATNTSPNVYVSYPQAQEFLEINIKPSLTTHNYHSLIGEIDKMSIKDNKGLKG